MTRIFLSSVITSLESWRDAAETAVRQFASDRGVPVEVIRTEHRTAEAYPPVTVCEELLARSDIVVGLYGSAYGFVDPESCLSVTHLELRWAFHKYHKPLLAFLLPTASPDDRQQELIRELESFRLGVFRSAVTDPTDLHHSVYRALTAAGALTLEAAVRQQSAAFQANDFYHVLLPLRCGFTFADSGGAPSSSDPYLRDAVEAQLTQSKNFVFVLGEAGSGKTWFLKSFFAERLQRFVAGSQPPSSAVPLYFDLAIISSETLLASGDEFMARLVATQYARAPVLESAAAGTFATRQPHLLLFDGFDEAVAKGQGGIRLRLLTNILSCVRFGASVVLTSRSHLFETEESLRHVMHAAGVGASPGSNVMPSPVLFVKSLSAADIVTFLQTEYGASAADLQRKMESLIDLSDLARRPILLPMVCKTLANDDGQLEQLGRISAGYLYRLFTSIWLAREAPKLPLDESVVRAFFCELALHFHNTGTDEIFFSHIPDVFAGFFPAPLFAAERSRLETALRTASFLGNRPAGDYHFLHRSFLEYFLAERVVAAIQTEASDLTLERFPSKLTDAFIVDLLEREQGWERKVLSVLHRASYPIFRYLLVYVLNRLIDRHASLSRDSVASELLAQLETETDPVVVREILVTLRSHALPVASERLERHLLSPIPTLQIVRELEEYYGSTAEARLYLRDRLSSGPEGAGPLAIFYIISLSAIATEDDAATFHAFLSSADSFERQVATTALHRISGGQDAN